MLNKQPRKCAINYRKITKTMILMKLHTNVVVTIMYNWLISFEFSKEGEFKRLKQNQIMCNGKSKVKRIIKSISYIQEVSQYDILRHIYLSGLLYLRILI